MAEKVTEMLLRVDLNCYSCTKELKKILGKFPQIRETVYDEKKNTVKITVVCCSPEKIRDKLCCRGGKVIQTIEILEAPKPEPKKENKNEADKPAKESEKTKQEEKEPVQKPLFVEVACLPVLVHVAMMPPQQFYSCGQCSGGPCCHLDRCCDYYFSEDNPSSCAIM